MSRFLNLEMDYDYDYDFSEKYVYDDEYILSIKNDGFDYDLPVKTLELINRIAKMVGAPSYIKTPIFHKHRRNNNHNYKKDNIKKKRTKNPKPLSDKEWETIRSFEETKMKKIQEGIEKDISLITTQFNKLTNDTFEVCSSEINDILENLTKVAKKEDMFIVCNNLFEIASSNRFYSRVFAKLLANIINTFELMKEVFYDNFKHFMDSFQEFEYINPEEDYDGFCELNKKNERRVAYAACIGNLVNESIIDVNEVITIITRLFEMFYNTIKEENKKYVSEQIINIIEVIISSCLQNIKQHPNFEEHINNELQNIVRLKRREYASLSSKSIFKIMELNDVISNM